MMSFPDVEFPIQGLIAGSEARAAKVHRPNQKTKASLRVPNRRHRFELVLPRPDWNIGCRPAIRSPVQPFGESLIARHPFSRELFRYEPALWLSLGIPPPGSDGIHVCARPRKQIRRNMGLPASAHPVLSGQAGLRTSATRLGKALQSWERKLVAVPGGTGNSSAPGTGGMSGLIRPTADFTARPAPTPQIASAGAQSSP